MLCKVKNDRFSAIKGNRPLQLYAAAVAGKYLVNGWSMRMVQGLAARVVWSLPTYNAVVGLRAEFRAASKRFYQQ
jgi:hypothetical protein